LKDILGEEYTEEFVQKLIDEVDIDRDGRVSFDEFLASLHGTTREGSKNINVTGAEEVCSSNLNNLTKLNFLVPENFFEQYRCTKFSHHLTAGITTFNRKL